MFTVSQCICGQRKTRGNQFSSTLWVLELKKGHSILLSIKWLPTWDFFAQCQGSSIKWLAFIHLYNSAIDSRPSQQSYRMTQANSHGHSSTDSASRAEVLGHSYPRLIISVGEKYWRSVRRQETPALTMSFSGFKMAKDCPR